MIGTAKKRGHGVLVLSLKLKTVKIQNGVIIGSFHVKTANFQKKFPLDPLRFCWNFIKIGFSMNNEDLQSFSFGSCFVQKICPPNFAPQLQKFLAFSPKFESSYLWIEVTQIAQTWNFYRHFPTNFRYGFKFLIPCLNFELQTFKNARFFKNILFYTFFEGGYLISQILQPHQTSNAP